MIFHLSMEPIIPGQYFQSDSKPSTPVFQPVLSRRFFLQCTLRSCLWECHMRVCLKTYWRYMISSITSESTKPLIFTEGSQINLTQFILELRTLLFNSLFLLNGFKECIWGNHARIFGIYMSWTTHYFNVSLKKCKYAFIQIYIVKNPHSILT